MKKVVFLSIIALMVSSINLSASPTPEPKPETQVQTSKVIHGMVFDNLTNETLAGAVITANNQKVYTDLDGNFSISNLCEGKCQLKISLISYKDQIIELDLHNSQTVQIKLQQR